MVWKLLALLSAVALVATACGGDDGDDAPAAGSTETTAAATTAAPDATDEVVDTQGCDKTFHVITHGDAGTFWSVVEAAVRDAEALIGCEVNYFGSINDAQAQSQEIEAAIAAGSDGIAISLADPAGVEAAARAVTEAGIPLYTINSGLNNYRDLGAVTHIGQDEIVAGWGAGRRFNDAGATKLLCARQEQTNVALEERCDGAAETFNGEVVSEFVGLDQNPDEQENTIAAILQGNPDIDAVLGVGPNLPLRAVAAGESAGRDLVIGGFDLSGDLLSAIEAGDVAFTVDQQQYLQGFIPVMLMYLQAVNLNTAGGGEPVLTGPGFVDTANAAQVSALVEAGTR